MNLSGRTPAPAGVSSSKYRDELTRAMTWLGEQQNSLFLGQSVAFPGTGITPTLAGVPKDRLIELPVMEDAQLGFCTGLALAGYVPVSIFPRWSFLLCATNQLVSHLDKLPLYSGYRPKVIVRTAVPTKHPLDPGVQHLGNMTDPFRQMCKSIDFIELTGAHQIYDAYRKAYERTDGRSTLIVEHASRYA